MVVVAGPDIQHVLEPYAQQLGEVCMGVYWGSISGVNLQHCSGKVERQHTGKEAADGLALLERKEQKLFFGGVAEEPQIGLQICLDQAA